jgi:branched-chain amino acid transport system substrate-binding protein
MRRSHTLSAVAVITAVTIGSALVPARAATTPGVTSDSILVGTSLPESGPAAAYGVIANGERAYFDYVNAHGGVYGRKLSLSVLDDGYDPARTKANVQNLVLSKGVFALLGVLGTANNLAARPIIDQNKVPLVYPATGSSLMAHPLDPYTFALQVTYTIEGKVLTDYAVKTLHAKKIGVFYQNDDFGMEGLNAVKARAALDGATFVDAEPYDLTQTDLSPQALKLQQAGADAVIIFAVPTPYITFVSTAPKVGLKAALLSSSVALSYGIIKVLGPAAAGLYFDDYATLPGARNNAQAVLYRSVVTKYGSPTTTPIDTFTEAGVGAAEVFVEGLRRAGPNLTRPGFIRALETMHGYSGSLLGKLTFSPTNHAGVQGAYMVQVRNGNVVPVTGYQYP